MHIGQGQKYSEVEALKSGQVRIKVEGIYPIDFVFIYLLRLPTPYPLIYLPNIEASMSCVAHIKIGCALRKFAWGLIAQPVVWTCRPLCAHPGLRLGCAVTALGYKIT
jgi:hypothetical protein